MLENSNSSFAFRKSSLQPFLFAMLLVIGFHFTQISNFSNNEREGTFYENSSTKVSTPFHSSEINHLADLATFEKEEKSESESESQPRLAVDVNKSFSVDSFFLISGAAKQSLKIPSNQGKAALYILFKNFRVHLA